MAGHVFVSYSHNADDTAYVARLASHLADHDINAWFDREIVSGDRWEQLIQEKIDTCSDHVLGELRAIGVRLAVDDFGSGYSSLTALTRLPPTDIKIDQTFVHSATSQPEAATVMSTMLELGRLLHLGVIAEGVETADQVAWLAEHACPAAQGHFFSRALPAAAVAGYLREHSSR